MNASVRTTVESHNHLICFPSDVRPAVQFGCILCIFVTYDFMPLFPHIVIECVLQTVAKQIGKAMTGMLICPMP